MLLAIAEAAFEAVLPGGGGRRRRARAADAFKLLAARGDLAHEQAAALARSDIAVGDQLLAGEDDGVACHAELLPERPRRRQALTGTEDAGEDRVDQLLADLILEPHARGRVYHERIGRRLFSSGRASHQARPLQVPLARPRRPVGPEVAREQQRRHEIEQQAGSASNRGAGPHRRFEAAVMLIKVGAPDVAEADGDPVDGNDHHHHCSLQPRWARERIARSI